MKHPIYLEDSYVKEIDTTIKSVTDGKFVELEDNIFYAKGGGQPFDTGKLVKDDTEFKVIFVGKFDGKISHQVEPESQLKEGDKVKCVLDWDRRYKLMRSHTATHILAAVMHNEAKALITGNQIDVDRTRIDFSLEDFDREKINEYISKANEHIKRNLEIKTYFLPKEEAMKIEGVVKLAGALPPDIAELRIVEIGDVDLQADGGTHVNNTSEIGEIELVKCDNKGKSNRRVYFKLKD